MSKSSAPNIDDVRRAVSSKLDPERRSMLGQFMTPTAIADFMASMFCSWPQQTKLLDPGAGIGSLSEAFHREFLKRAPAGAELQITAYEIDPVLQRHLVDHLKNISKDTNRANRTVRADIRSLDFIEDGTFSQSFSKREYTHAILNPPYKKMGVNSNHRKMLRAVGVETVNLYTAFLSVAVALCVDGGEIVAIVPRSFCNGLYYRPFREWLLSRVAIKTIHIFEARNKAFKEDRVLQENIIVHLIRGGQQGDVVISTSHDASFSDQSSSTFPFSEIVQHGDRERYIHIPTCALQSAPALFSQTLKELGISVSTGPVVDFRLRNYWIAEPLPDSIPLLYAHHFSGGYFQWPRVHRKPNALSPTGEVPKWLMPRGWYVVTKRFSSKEERKRVVAYVVDPNKLPAEQIGFENHLNVFHISKNGLDPLIARGLAIFLNSTIFDQYFRNFSGHTQVNATDLRSMRFPSLELLKLFGEWAEQQSELPQTKIDRYVGKHYAK